MNKYINKLQGYGPYWNINNMNKYQSKVKGMKDPIIDYKRMAEDLRKALRETTSNLKAFYSQMAIDNDPIEHIIKRNEQLLKGGE